MAEGDGAAATAADAAAAADAWTFEPPQSLATACRQWRILGATHTLLVFVPIAANASSQRAAVRQTWGGAALELVTFMVQLRDGQPLGQALAEEAAQHDDIFVARGPHADSYDCLTLKVLAFLRWHAAECAGAFRYLLKSDHDSYWYGESLLRLLRARIPATADPNDSKAPDPPVPEILGSIQRHALVRRDPRSKFCTSPEAYPGRVYPDYATGGPGYLLSAAAAAAIVEADAAASTPPLWLEDVHVTGVLAAAAANATGLRLVHSDNIRYAPAAVDLLELSRPQPQPSGTTTTPTMDASSAAAAAAAAAEAAAEAALAGNPPLGVHGLTERQLHRLHRAMTQQALAVARRASQIHSFQ